MFLFTQMFPKLRGDFYEPSWVFFQNFPIHVVDPSNATEVQQRDYFIDLVENMLELHRFTPTTPQEKDHLERTIENTVDEIDLVVNNFYGVTDEAIKIAELS